MLSELSLAKNNITDFGAEKIAVFMESNGNKLRVLNLHWNKIKFKGGIRITDAIKQNEILKILDLSWNHLGKWNPAFLGRLPLSEV